MTQKTTQKNELTTKDQALYDKANSYLEANQAEKAEPIILKLTRKYPTVSSVWGILGVCYYDQLKFEKTYQAFQNIAEKANNKAFYAFKTGFLHLLAGDYQDGWKLYMERKRQKMPIPFLTAKNSETCKHILVLREQGYGDIIQFARFFYPLRNYFPDKKITFLCPPPMLRLFHNLGKQLNINFIHQLEEEDVPKYDFDAYTHLCSLPIHLGLKKEHAGLVDNFFTVNTQKVNQLRQQLPKPAIGFCWTGRKGYPRFYNRDCPNEDAQTFLEAFPDVKFVSLMKPDVKLPDGVEKLYGHKGLDNQYIAEVKDFYDLATLISALDAVVTVDSAPLHVAATLGKPTYSMIGYAPDWRWMMGQTDSLWYPSCQLFRQTMPGDWAHVVDDVIEALRYDLPKYTANKRA